MTIPNVFHTRDDEDYIYVTRNKVGRGLANIVDATT